MSILDDDPEFNFTFRGYDYGSELPNEPTPGEFTAESMQRAIDNMIAHIEEIKKNGPKPKRTLMIVPNKQAEEFVVKWENIFGINIEK